MHFPEDFFRWLVIFFVRPQQQSKPLFVGALFDREKIGKALTRIALAVALSTMPVSLSFAEQPREQSFNIPQQSVQTALTSLATQANVYLLFPYDQVIAVNANPVQGTYSVQQALNILLHNTGLSGDLTEGGVLAISRAGANASGTENYGKGKSMNTTNSSKRKTVLAGLVGLFAAGGMGSAMAQGGEIATEQGRIDEIVVTANKREQRLQDTAMSITALGAEEIEHKSLVSMSDYLNTIPGVSMLERGVAPNQIIIRGIGLSQLEQASVSAYFGEVPLTSPVGVGSSVDMKMVDLERVEILRGPQGTLYGSGAIGGTVRNIPVTPSLNTFEGKFDVGYSNTSRTNDDNNKLVGIFNLPFIEDALALRVVAYRFNAAGYIDRVSTPEIEALADSIGTTVNIEKDAGEHIYTGGRATMLWQPNDKLKLNLVWATQTLEEDETTRGDVSGSSYTATAFNVPAPIFSEDKFDLFNLTVDYNFDWATITASYSYHEGDHDRQEDMATSGLSFAGVLQSIQEDRKGDTVELRLSSQLESPFRFIGGIYYEDFELHDNLVLEWFGSDIGLANSFFVPNGLVGKNGFPIVAEFPPGRDQLLEQKAVFGELAYTLNSQWELTAGARRFDYNRRDIEQDKFFIGPIPGSDVDSSESGTTLKANISYTPNDDSLVYLQWTEGFRVGRGQVPPPASLCDLDNDGVLDGTKAPLSNSVDSDNTTNIELGGKFTLLDSRLALNATLFRVDWEDIPIRLFGTCGLGVDSNAGKAQSQGFELETRFHVTENLQLSLSASYMDTEFLDDTIGAKGDRLPLSSRINGVVGVNYNFTLASYNAFMSSSYSYKEGHESILANPLYADVESHGKWNLRTGIEVDQWSFALYGKNLTNENAVTYGTNPGFIGYRLRPRTMGVELSYAF